MIKEIMSADEIPGSRYGYLSEGSEMALNPLIRKVIDSAYAQPYIPSQRVNAPADSVAKQAEYSTASQPEESDPNRRRIERRSGEDRRKRQVPVPIDTRSGRERRKGYRRASDVEAVRQGELPPGGPVRGFDESV